MRPEDYMQEAIAEARLAMGRTHPNPAVGAVIVQGDSIVARGHTQPAGGNHAEIEALEAYRVAGFQPDEATTLYVTMEPCSTTGRTGPCTEAILESGIRSVCIGTPDPNPLHRDRGGECLRSGGLNVRTGILAEECEDLNLIFNWRMKTGQQLIAGKVATTIDGRIATRGGLSKWITGPMARADVHAWRRYFPSIAVGAGTVLADNPSLTARCRDTDDWCPIRFIFDRNLITFKDGTFKVYTDDWKDRTIVIASTGHEGRATRLQAETGIRFWLIEDDGKDGGLDQFSQRCLKEGIDGVYVEGGASLISSFMKYRYIHYLFAYRAPKILADASGLAPFLGQEPASMDETVRLESVRHASLGDDQLMRGFVVYPEN